MKHPRCRTSALALALLACSPLAIVSSSAQTVTTDPVGFIKLTVAGTNGAGGTKTSLAGLGLQQPVLYQGVAESVGANSITDTEGTWTANLYNGTGNACYVEILSGTNAGVILDIATTSVSPTKTITTVQNLPAGTPASVSFRIRKHWTLSSLFGATNQGGLFPGSNSTADQVQLLDPATGGFETYFYSSGGKPGIGWRKIGGGSSDQKDQVIYPDEGIVFQRQQVNPVSLVVMGSVKTGKTSTPIAAGINVVGNMYAASLTLNDSGLASSGISQGSSATADLVMLFNGSGYDSYYYSSGGKPGVGWRMVGGGSTDASGVLIPVGAAVVIQRNGSTGFNWVIPQHPSSLTNPNS